MSLFHPPGLQGTFLWSVISCYGDKRSLCFRGDLANFPFMFVAIGQGFSGLSFLSIG